MDNGKISVRYARALLGQAQNEHCADEVYACLMRLTANYGLAINQFNEVLSNPMVGIEEKLRLLHTAIGEPIHPCVTRFLEFLTAKKRENKVFLIALEYQELYRKANNIIRADVTTAMALDDPTLDHIRTFVEQTFHRTVEMHVKLDPTIIGGFTLDIEHNRMDASIKGQLEKLKTENGKLKTI
jgi:F-type H+-transporting ATPase subunit delta